MSFEFLHCDVLFSTLEYLIPPESAQQIYPQVLSKKKRLNLECGRFQPKHKLYKYKKPCVSL